MPKRFLANGLAAYLDFTIGSLLVVLLASAFAVELSWWQILIGGFLALLPDMDIAPMLIIGRTPRFDHRQTILHRPAVVLPLVALLGYIVGGSFWSLAGLILVLYHFLHDVDWAGRRYGVAWFWPFSNQFWGPYGSFTPPTDISHETWLQDHWLQPSRLSVVELGLSFVAGILLGLWLGIILTWWFWTIVLLAVAVPLYVWYG